MKVVSLFDGISCGQVALHNLGIKVDCYYASEIKHHAIFCTKMNFPKTIHIGDIKKVYFSDGVLYTSKGNYYIGEVDILIGGSPCQDFSFLNTKQLGLEGEKSKLFYEYFRLFQEIKPRYFLLENVKMKREYKEKINRLLGVEAIEIDSSLVSFQKRRRLYWTNIPNVTIPKDQGINFQDYKEKDPEIERKYKANRTPSRERTWNFGKNKSSSLFGCKNITNSKKIDTITTKQDRSPNAGLIEFEDFFRFLTREELELGQTLPLGYTKCLSLRAAMNLIGDGWTVKAVEHIFSFLPSNQAKKIS